MRKVNPFSETFSSVLFNIIDFEKQLIDVTNIFTETLKGIDEKNFLNIDFLDSYQSYPKYPLNFKVIDNLNNYNILTIYNTASDDLGYLIESITKMDILSLKNNFDAISESHIN